ncbi:MAG TPA: hypothetical protein VLA14_16175 [Polyangia bacterium]|nr:hypothetical protein [Polyangia bacterium]
MRRHDGVFLSLALAHSLVLVGCASSFALRDSNVYVAPTRLAAMPPDVVSYVLDADNHVTAEPEATRATRAAVEASLNERLSSAGARFFPETSLAQVPGYAAFGLWARRALGDIDVEITRAEHQRSSSPGVYVWRYSGDLAPMRAALDADFVLMSVFLDGDNTMGRFLLNTTGGRGWVARRLGEACAVDLRDGRVVWCAHDYEGTERIRTRQNAQKAVDRLLAQLLAMKPRPSIPAGAVPRAAASAIPDAPAPPVPQKGDDDDPDNR